MLCTMEMKHQDHEKSAEEGRAAAGRLYRELLDEDDAAYVDAFAVELATQALTRNTGSLLSVLLRLAAAVTTVRNTHQRLR